MINGLGLGLGAEELPGLVIMRIASPVVVEDELLLMALVILQLLIPARLTVPTLVLPYAIPWLLPHLPGNPIGIAVGRLTDPVPRQMARLIGRVPFMARDVALE